MAVGSNQGQAFVYDRSNLFWGRSQNPDRFAMYRRELELREDKKSALEAAKKAKLEKFQMETPDYWYRHNAELQARVDELDNMGSEIAALDIDPFKSNDPASAMFQKKKVELERLANFSNQLKDNHKEYLTRIAAAGKDGGGKYTTESIESLADYFERPLAELANANEEPPQLKLARPDFDRLKYDTDIAKSVQSEKPNVSDADIQALAAKSLDNPDIAGAIRQKLQRVEQQLGEEALVAMQNMAENNGMDLPTYLRFQEMKPHFANPEDTFDFTTVESMIKPGGYDITQEEGDKTTREAGTSKRKARTLAELHVTPAYVKAGLKTGRFAAEGADPTKSLEENMEAAIRWNVKKAMAEGDYRKSETYDEGSGDGRLMAESRNIWLENLRSGNPDRVQLAADYLKGITLEDGTTVEYVNLMPDVTEEGQYIIELHTVKGMTQVDEDDETRKVWEPQQEIQKIYTKQFNAATGVGNSDEFLFDYHDNSFKRDKRSFGETIEDVPEYKIPGQ
jgi:hypothetical protein